MIRRSPRVKSAYETPPRLYVNLVKRPLQQAVEVRQGYRVFILETHEQSLLNGAKLMRALTQAGVVRRVLQAHRVAASS